MEKEIGGYIEFEHYNGREYHKDAIKLNCARNCLAYLIKLHNIHHIYIPYYLCDSVYNVCKKYDLQISFYHIDKNFLPILPDADFTKNWFYLVNYYGQISNQQIQNYSKSIKNLIVDNVQAFFQMPVEHIPTIYTCRKFFGVTDGAYLYSDKLLDEKLELDVSYKRMEFLFGRFEKCASDFYSQYNSNNKLFSDEPIKRMSKLTENLMCSLDYEMIKKIRTENFSFLHEKLYKINELKLSVPEGAFAYPLFIEDGVQLRKQLQEDKIYIPTLWPDIYANCKENDLEYNYARNILPLPIDQRYDVIIMKYISNKIIGE